MANIPVGVQLYTLRNETSTDFLGTLEKVAKLGFHGVEFAGYGDIPAKQMRQALDNLGLKAISSHVGMTLLETELERQIEYNLEIGSKFIVCPWLPIEQLKDETAFSKTMADFRMIGETIKRSGLEFAYHNHDFEFQQVNGSYILDRMYQEVDADLMKVEMDLYWVKKAGENPRDYLLQYKGRTPLLHVKDMANDAEGSFAEVGHGVIDFPSVFNVAEEAGVQYYIVEQDVCKRPPLESVEMSLRYLQSIGIA